MGRGLSEQQKEILRILYARGAAQREVAHAEVMAALYGWSAAHARDIRRRQHNFASEDIGVAEYNSKRASYHRAVSRLEDRGLVERWYGMYLRGNTAVTLTAEGMRAAKDLSVSEVKPVNSANR